MYPLVGQCTLRRGSEKIQGYRGWPSADVQVGCSIVTAEARGTDPGQIGGTSPIYKGDGHRRSQNYATDSHVFKSRVLDTCFVGMGKQLVTLDYFDFAPTIAPTMDILFPQTVRHQVLVATGGESPIVTKDDWIIDSGCTSHMSHDRTLFSHLAPYTTHVQTAGAPTKVTHKGTAILHADLKDSTSKISLSNTLLVPSLPINLISQSKLDNLFYINTQNGYEVRSRENDQILLTATLINGLYVVDRDAEVETAFVAKESLQLWHERLGHINVRRLKTMKDGAAEGISFNEVDLKNFSG